MFFAIVNLSLSLARRCCRPRRVLMAQLAAPLTDDDDEGG